MLEQIKSLLGFEAHDASHDDLLNTIVSLTKKRLCVLINAEVVPEVLQYIVVEVAVVRFNRIGSEGFSSHDVEGETIAWNDDNDFAGYMDDITAYLRHNNTKGVLRFL